MNVTYQEICQELLDVPHTSSPRGLLTKEIVGMQYEAGPNDYYFTHPAMPDNLDYIMAEIEWYIKGDRNDLSILEHAKAWAPHVQDGMLNSNYGYWLGTCGHLRSALETLDDDRDSRRAIALIGDVECYESGVKDVPCTQHMHFMVRDEILINIVSMRSQDIWFGFRNDLAFFQFITSLVAMLVEADDSKLIVNVGSLHAYERNWAKLKELTNHRRAVDVERIDLKGQRLAAIRAWNLS